MRQKLNLTRLKLRIVGEIMDGQTCSNCFFLIVVISRNELGDGIVVDTGWVRML